MGQTQPSLAPRKPLFSRLFTTSDREMVYVKHIQIAEAVANAGLPTYTCASYMKALSALT
jgi:hypothetical protein